MYSGNVFEPSSTHPGVPWLERRILDTLNSVNRGSCVQYRAVGSDRNCSRIRCTLIFYSIFARHDQFLTIFEQPARPFVAICSAPSDARRTSEFMRKLGLFVVVLASLPIAAFSQPAGWNDPFPPHHVMDNVYFVGTKELASFLITTP